MAGSKPSGSKKGAKKTANGGPKSATPEPPAVNGSLSGSSIKVCCRLTSFWAVLFTLPLPFCCENLTITATYFIFAA
jgi:hypothetical protein